VLEDELDLAIRTEQRCMRATPHPLYELAAGETRDAIREIWDDTR
jgi:hypothetical protein